MSILLAIAIDYGSLFGGSKVDAPPEHPPYAAQKLPFVVPKEEAKLPPSFVGPPIPSSHEAYILKDKTGEVWQHTDIKVLKEWINRRNR